MAALTLAIGSLLAVPPAAAIETCAPDANRIVCENRQEGTDPSVWDIEGAGDPDLQGFATEISVNAGSTIDFKIDTDAADYTIDIYRTGWYQGLGARHVDEVTPSAALPQTQPECLTDARTLLYDCGTWGVSASWQVPATAVSGVYLAVLNRDDTGGRSHIIFVVRNDGNASDVLFQTSDSTWQAYNSYGGADFYQGGAAGRAYEISYNRPFATRQGVTQRDFYFSSEFATVRFLERNGYDVSYLAGADTDRRGDELLNHEVFLSVGHDEYWTGAQRRNVEAARDAGVDLQFLTGNEMYWRTRWAPGADGSPTDHRTLVSYKETWNDKKIDPSDEWTGTWRDPRFADADAGAASPENEIIGTMYMVNDGDLPLTVSGAEGRLRMWRGTDLATAPLGSRTELAPHTVGYESNEVVDNGRTPAGLIRLSTTVGPVDQYLTDYGNTLVAGTTQHHTTLYQAASGALVFSAGSVQWGWGLDAEHDGDGAPADRRMQQAQVNLLADMGALPGDLMDDLVPATESADATPPTTVITSPAEGAAVTHGSPVTVTGTAADADGVVAGVEVSTDGGQTWFAAQGTTDWSYSYIQQGTATAEIRARAIDDSANFSTDGTVRTVAVSGDASLFGVEAPRVASVTDSQALELGLRFRTTTDGAATGVRFFKGAANTGVHSGALWSARGERLATVAFEQESATGWQTARFATPVQLTAGTTYTVSYTAPAGGYAYQEEYWPYAARSSSPIEPAPGSGAAAAGVHGQAGQWPTQPYRNANYYVDVLFDPSAGSPVRLTDHAPAVDGLKVSVGSAISAVFTQRVVASSIVVTVTGPDGTRVAGTIGYDAATRRVRFVPSQPLANETRYTVTVSADAADTRAAPLVDGSWSFRTAALIDPDAVCPCTVHDDLEDPAIASAADSDPVTVGTAFTVSENAVVTGIRYYRGAGNLGPHSGTLWGPGETELAAVDFDDETASGWQTATFASPVPVSPGRTYVVSYRAPAGGYAVTPGRFTAATEKGPLTVPASGGSFTYGTGYPNRRSTSSYYVDPIVERTADGPRLVSATPAPGRTGVDPDSDITASFAEALTATPGVEVRSGGESVEGTVSRSADGTRVTFDPVSPLPFGVDVTVTVVMPSPASGPPPRRSWSFRTAADPNAPVALSLHDGGTPPGMRTADDGGALELGMRFSSEVPARVTGIRFYAPAADSVTRTGTLWDADGRRLTSVEFPTVTGAGWQRATLAAPVALAAGATYTVSYSAPTGAYAYVSEGFSRSVENGPLSAATADNGVFRSGADGGMPTQSWRSTDYLVDVEVVAGASDGTTPAIAERSPVGAGAPAGDPVTAALTADAPGATLHVTQDGDVVEGASTYDASSRTVSFTPTTAFSAATTYRASVRLAGQGGAGQVLDTWEFTTRGPEVPGTAQTLFASETPAIASANDSAPVTLGTAFEVERPGLVTAIRFYKGAGNTGRHVGRLWAPDGTELARVVFAAESPTGWQRAPLSTPVAVEPGRTYTVSYFAPSGGYAVTLGYFDSRVVRDEITAPAQTGGRYVYGADGQRPAAAAASGYFVDAEVVFSADDGAPSATAGDAVAATPTVAPIRSARRYESLSVPRAARASEGRRTASSRRARTLRDARLPDDAGDCVGRMTA